MHITSGRGKSRV